MWQKVKPWFVPLGSESKDVSSGSLLRAKYCKKMGVE